MLEDKVKLLGRTKKLGDKLLLKDSYSGISFYAKGGVSLTLTPERG